MEDRADTSIQVQQQLSLAGILDSEVTEEMYAAAEAQQEQAAEGWDQEEGTSVKEGYCVECEGHIYYSSFNRHYLICRL